MKKLLVIAVVIFLYGCVAQQPLIKQTQSGRPEGVFRNTNVEEVKSRIIEGIVSKGLMVMETTSNQIVCGKTMEGGQAVLAQMIVGNSYSTTPQDKIRFTVYQVGTEVKVTAYEWIESQMALGQVNTQELNGNNQKNGLQNFLFSIGAE